MTVLRARPDFVYGNTRLRARKAELLSAAEYDALLGGSLDEVYAVLTQTSHQPEVEAAQAGRRSELALQNALRRHLARVLQELRSFYQGRARDLVDLLLARYDLHNLLSILRGHAREQSADRILATIIPLGELGGAAGEEIARQREPRAAVALLVGWRLPDAATARVLADAWSEFERTENLAALEHAVTAAHALALDEALAEEAEAEPLRELTARERDTANALAVLRLREALQLDELTEAPAVGDHVLAGGTIRTEALAAALREPRREDAAATLAVAARRGDWRHPLERYGGTGDLQQLQRELELARVRWALALFLRGDPLGLDVPIAYTVAKENEQRNLRLIGEGAAHGIATELLRHQLLVPGSGDRWGS